MVGMSRDGRFFEFFGNVFWLYVLFWVQVPVFFQIWFKICYDLWKFACCFFVPYANKRVGVGPCICLVTCMCDRKIDYSLAWILMNKVWSWNLTLLGHCFSNICCFSSFDSSWLGILNGAETCRSSDFYDLSLDALGTHIILFQSLDFLWWTDFHFFVFQQAGVTNSTT